MIISLYKHLCHDNEQIDDVTNALYYAILYGQINQVKLLINHATGIDQAMLTRKIAVKRISLMELAAQSKNILTILETKIAQPENVAKSTEPYRAWYEQLASLSSTL